MELNASRETFRVMTTSVRLPCSEMIRSHFCIAKTNNFLNFLSLLFLFLLINYYNSKTNHNYSANYCPSLGTDQGDKKNNYEYRDYPGHKTMSNSCKL